MDKMGSPRGLIRYTTEHALQGRATHILRPRLLVYVTLLLALVGGLSYLLIVRTPLIVDVLRDRNALFREVHDGRIENSYLLRIINQDDRPHRYHLLAAGLEGLTLVDPTGGLIEVPSGSVTTVPARLQAPAVVAQGVHSVTLALVAQDAPRIAVRETTRFIGPKS